MFLTFSHVVPADTPQDFVAVVLNSTSVHLSWSEPILPYGIITSYTLYYNLTDVDDNRTLDSSARSYVITALNEFTFYSFSIYASTRVGAGPAVDVTARTDEYCEWLHVFVHYWKLSSFQIEHTITLLNVVIKFVQYMYPMWI